MDGKGRRHPASLAWRSSWRRSGADVLTGLKNPSGKLSETFPASLEQTPAYIDFPARNKEATYGESLFIGYRYYDAKKIEPMFPFGFGLSYTLIPIFRPAGEPFKDQRIAVPDRNDQSSQHRAYRRTRSGSVICSRTKTGVDSAG